MNNQTNIIDFQNARDALNGLKKYINNKNQKSNFSNQMQLAEQNKIVTDKIEEKPLSAIDINNSTPSPELIEPQIIEPIKAEAIPSLVTGTSQPIPTPPAIMETTIADNQFENNGISKLDGQLIQPSASTEKTIVQTSTPEPTPMVIEPQMMDAPGMANTSQNMVINSNNNNLQTSTVPSSSTLAQDTVETSLNSGTSEIPGNGSIASEETGMIQNSNGLEVVPQIDINTVIGENSNPETVNDKDNEAVGYKAATNMGAVAINDSSSMTNSGEVTIPTGQESVPQPSSPVVTEASFSETPETIKLAA